MMALDLGIPFPLRRDYPGLPPGLLPPEFPAEHYTLLLQETLSKLREAESVIADQKERIEHLETLSMTDELTGLLNRRGFKDAFRRELAASRRGTGTGVLVMVDLDGFKAINDTYGHLAGDHYLRQVAKVLKDSVRGHDVVARLGGDEFAVLLTRIDAESGMARAAALADRFNGRSCDWQRHRLPLRASFGAEPFGAQEREEDVMRRADVLMYATKAKRKAKR